MADSTHEHEAIERPTGPRYEPAARSVRPVVVFLVLFVGAAVVLCGVVALMCWGYWAATPPAPPGPFTGQLPPVPEPRLQADPPADLAALRAREHAALTTYGWVDRPRGLVRVPIDEAMRLLVESQGGASTQPAEGGR